LEEGMNKTTIADIAKTCGVSTKTVSRVINNSSDVKEKTREIVLAALNDSNYRANILAKGLRGGRTNIIIVFIDKHNDEHLSIWHNMMLRYLFIYAKKRGMQLIISTSSSEKYIEDEMDGFSLISSGVADGVILLENVSNDPRIDYFRRKNIPYIVFGEPDEPKVSSVSLDNYSVGFTGGKYLAEKGYTDIAFFVGDEEFLSTKLRVSGFEDAMKGKKVKYFVNTNIDNVKKSYERSVKLLKQRKIDAFFVSGDERAIGVYRGIYEQGLSIPKDVAVLGIDNIILGSYLHPPISTLNQDFEAMAKACVDFVVDSIESQSIIDVKLRVPTKVIEREST
jgi:DNA-binding LacI/PurR family transcriptional regulator